MTLANEFKKESKLKEKFKEYKDKVGLDLYSIWQNLEVRYKEKKSKKLKEAQDKIREMAKTKPEILKTRPEVEKQLRTPEGYMKYLQEWRHELTDPEKRLYHPELNNIILSYDDKVYDNSSIAKFYLNGYLNEDEMRLNDHLHALLEYENEYEDEIEELKTINNEMWVDRLKLDTGRYILTVKDPEFQKWSLSYAQTEDKYRVDLGLAISRDPIFFG